MKRIICRNGDNIEVSFAYDFDPFFLLSCEGIMSVYNNVVTSENTMVDGSTYQGATARQRNIVLTAQMFQHCRENRELIYKTFKPKATGTFFYIEDDKTLKIDYKVESIEIAEKGIVRDIVVSLICPDPFFRALEETFIDMAGWLKKFKFMHAFQAGGEAFGRREASQIMEIPNDSAAANIGLNIALKAEGTVVNPMIYHIESGDYIKVNIALNSGDELLITTETNHKNVYMIRGGIKTEINQFLDEDSEFIQLQHGKNTLQYSAGSGEEYLNVRISYQQKYLGV